MVQGCSIVSNREKGISLRISLPGKREREVGPVHPQAQEELLARTAIYDLLCPFRGELNGWGQQPRNRHFK